MSNKYLDAFLQLQDSLHDQLRAAPTDEEAELINEDLAIVDDAIASINAENEKHSELMRVGKSAYSSIADMVAALNCDYDRLQELREAKYCYGSNLCGYMPDNLPDTCETFKDSCGYIYLREVDNLPDTCETFKEAQEATIAAIEEYRDDDDCTKPLAEDYEKAIEFCKQQTDCFSVVIDGKCFFVALNESDKEELAELETAAGECESRDDAEQRIQEDALSVEVRSDWFNPSHPMDSPQSCEFRILLSTGGPASRIVGELRDGEPISARLEVQNWFTPWTEYNGDEVSESVLLDYCRCFYFGEG